MHWNRKQPVVINARFLTQPITGVQRFAVELCLHLRQLLPDLTFIAPRNILHEDIAQRLGVQVYGKLTGHLWEQFELPLLLKKKQNPLLINLCNTAPVFYSNKIVCLHDLAFIVNPEWFSKPFSSFYKLVIPQIAKSSRKIITVSNYSKSSIVELLHVPDSKIEVIYNAVSDSSFTPSGVADNKYGDYILAVGSLDPRKNLNNLIKAFNSCNFQDTKLVIVGAASKIFSDPTLQLLLKENPGITLAGYLTDSELNAAYHHAKLFVYPSLFEGFGLPPLEAMHCGCATIVSNTTSLTEVCADASYFVDPTDSYAIAQAMKLLMKDKSLRAELVLKGYKRSKEFNWENSAEKLAQLIKAVS